MTVILVLGRQREEDLKMDQPGLHSKVTLLPTLFYLSPHNPPKVEDTELIFTLRIPRRL